MGLNELKDPIYIPNDPIWVQNGPKWAQINKAKSAEKSLNEFILQIDFYQ